MREKAFLGLTAAMVRKTASCVSTPALGAFLLVLMLLAGTGSPAWAAEYGCSGFTPGAQGDFAMNKFDPGLYFRQNLFHYRAELNDYPGVTLVDLGAGPTPIPIESDLKQDVLVALLQVAYVSEFEILGGRFFANINIPVGLDASLKTSTTTPLDPGLILDMKDTTTGLGDIQFVPFGLAWSLGQFHFLLAQNIVAPTGRYDSDEIVCMGRNYWSSDTLFGATWLDEEGGHEVSFLAGYTINAENSDTDYKTGDEFHVDYTLAQYLSEQLGFAIVGYYYEQMTDDEGDGYDLVDETFRTYLGTSLDGYRSKGAAVGPAVMWAPKVGDLKVNLIAKWLHEYYARNRFEGDWFWVSAVVRF
ncbi:MAG: transporter [Desulfomonilia bacterium]|jgi:hypothetical protein